MVGEAEKRIRTTAKRKFTRCYNRLNDYILGKEAKNIIIAKFNDFKLLWNMYNQHMIIIYLQKILTMKMKLARKTKNG